jgi:hypothetical protein
MLVKKGGNMFTGQLVKIRLKRSRENQRVRVLVGRALDMDYGWIKVEGKFFTLAKGETIPRVDEKSRILCIPRENISVARILPDNLDINDFKYTIKDNRLIIEIDDHQPLSISE